MKRNRLCIHCSRLPKFSFNLLICSCRNGLEIISVPKSAVSQPATQNSTLKKAKAVRGPSGYNLFCSDFFKSGKQC